jgi:hypothetical protein
MEFVEDSNPESDVLEQEKICVLIANSTRVWRDMLYETIGGEPDVEIVGDTCIP